MSAKLAVSAFRGSTLSFNVFIPSCYVTAIVTAMYNCQFGPFSLTFLLHSFLAFWARKPKISTTSWCERTW